MWFVKNPEWFDVIVTDNLFGDIITDLGGDDPGRHGHRAGGNINPEGTSMFEPIGGSAPKYTGKNVINPLAAICAGGLMLDFLGETKAAQAIENAVIKTVREKLQVPCRRQDGLRHERSRRSGRGSRIALLLLFDYLLNWLLALFPPDDGLFAFPAPAVAPDDAEAAG